MRYKIRNKVWVWGGGEKGSWHFLTVPPDVTERINKKYKEIKKGWGSLPVIVYFKVENSSYSKKKVEIVKLATSIFPNKKDKTFLLPIKKKTRLEVGIQDGDIIDFELEVKV